ncbi:uncharacterized protein LOC122249612 [Penaeus japonicus]|uniref:uncharacterized protein LOC122249612 n=1 Tax=Penaeus japonicus TaxID=27405 RepID=UPI001C70F553|nr:uncharacterized protein LOC122249612 [Penaeus japonicus]
MHLEGALALASCPSFGTTSATLHTLHPSLVALTCPTPESEVFAGDERVRVSQCFGGQWTVVDDACAADSKGAIGECPPATPPANSISNKDFSDSNGVFASYYECTEGQVWLSGMPGQVSQCIAGNWTQVLDVCTEGRRRRGHGWEGPGALAPIGWPLGSGPQ